MICAVPEEVGHVISHMAMECTMFMYVRLLTFDLSYISVLLWCLW